MHVSLFAWSVHWISRWLRSLYYPTPSNEGHTTVTAKCCLILWYMSNVRYSSSNKLCCLATTAGFCGQSEPLLRWQWMAVVATPFGLASISTTFVHWTRMGQNGLCYASAEVSHICKSSSQPQPQSAIHVSERISKVLCPSEEDFWGFAAAGAEHCSPTVSENKLHCCWFVCCTWCC